MKCNFWEVNCDLCQYVNAGGCGSVGSRQLEATLAA